MHAKERFQLSRRLFDDSFERFHESRLREAKKKAQEVPKSELRGNDLDDLVRSVTEEFRVEPIRLDLENKYSTDEEIRVPVNWYRETLPQGPEEPQSVEATQVTIHIPFSGTRTLLTRQPFPFSVNPPRAYAPSKDVDEICITAHVPRHLEDNAQQIIEDDFKGKQQAIERCLRVQEAPIERLHEALTERFGKSSRRASRALEPLVHLWKRSASESGPAHRPYLSTSSGRSLWKKPNKLPREGPGLRNRTTA